MNLNKRMLFVIGPVVLASYLLGMIGIFQLQKSLTLQAETNRAELQLSNLQTQYLNYKLAIDNILLAIREGNVLYRFLENPEDIYRNRVLTTLLERVLGRMEMKNSKIINVSILKPDQSQEFYFESSLNPFAEIHPEQLSFGREQWAKAKVDRHRLIGVTSGPALIVVQDRFDRRTLRESVNGDPNDQIILQVAVSPDRFWSELKKMEHDLHSTVVLGPTPFAAEPGRLQVPLAENLHASILINTESVDRQLRVVKLWMVLAGVVLGGASFGLLYWLIRRFVTAPIQELESQLEEVERSKGASLPRMESQDEVGRLSRRFAETYEALLKAYDKARFLAEVDLLTNLPNRAYFSGWVERVLALTSTQPEQLALLYIDLDNFKYVNDKYGHQTGDALLQKFSLRLTRTITTFTQHQGNVMECFGARLAGDEFAVVVKCDAALPTAQQLAEQILGLFSNGFSFEKGVFPVTASIGIVVYPRDGINLTQLVSNADSAMYQAKAAGKNCISTFSLALAREARRVREIEEHLKRGKIFTEFSLVYMPILDSKTQEVVAYEALLRWQSEELGFVRPDEFIPIAERTGHIEHIDRWVVSRAIRQYVLLVTPGKPLPRVCINLSGASLKTDQLLEHILHEVQLAEVSPQCIEFEITETYDASFNEREYRLVDQLRQRGFRFAIDDFGSGYTSLTKMAEFPVDVIKLDRIFINRMVAARREDILGMLVRMGQAMGMHVVAEGVETAEQAAMMRGLGCDFLQGYHFGKPCRVDEL